MRNLQKYAAECMHELDKLNIPYAKAVQFTVNTRAKKRWGQCRRTSQDFVISINARLLEERSEPSGLKNTIMHELLHTCRGCMNHGAKWKSYAKIVNDAYGYDIKRVTDPAEMGLPAYEQTPADYRYAVKCTGCGQMILRKKKSKLVQHPGSYRCARCGGRLRAYEIVSANNTNAVQRHSGGRKK